MAQIIPTVKHTVGLIKNRMKSSSGHINQHTAGGQHSPHTSGRIPPPRFTVLEDQFLDFFQALGPHFIAAGDYNAKHTHWGSRLVNTKGKQLYKTIIKATNKLDHVSPGNPTYWPSDLNKLPDLIDFEVTRNILRSLVKAEYLPDLSSDQFTSVGTQKTWNHYTDRLHTKQTDSGITNI